MTRHHFRKLADNLKSTRPGEHWDANKRLQWSMDVKAVANVCFLSNDRFDSDKFFEACGGLFDV